MGDSLTLAIHEVMRDRFEVIHTYYKGSTVTIIFTADSGVYTTMGGTEKTTDTRVNIKAIINHVKNPKVWGNVGIMGDSYLEMIVWESALNPELAQQFFFAANYDNIKILVGSDYFRVIEIQSPESWDNTIPYWNMLLQKLEHSPS